MFLRCPLVRSEGESDAAILSRISTRERERAAVADEGDGAGVGAVDRGAESAVALDDLGVGKAEGIAPAHAEDDVLGADELEEGLGGAGAGAVVRRLQEPSGKLRAGFEERALTLGLHVAR